MNIIKLFKKNQSKLFCLVCFVIIILLIICLIKFNRIDTFNFQFININIINLTKKNYENNNKFPLINGIRNYSSVTHIPENAFENFTEQITLKNLNNLKYIGTSAFHKATHTDSVVEITGKNNKLKTIGSVAFSGFKGTLTLKNLNKLQTIGDKAFFFPHQPPPPRLSFLNSGFTKNQPTLPATADSVVSITGDNHLQSIGSMAFKGFKGKITLQNLNKLKSIGDSALEGDINYGFEIPGDNQVEIPGDNQLESIGIGAFTEFNGTISLKNLNNLKSIGAEAFLSRLLTTDSVVSITDGNELETIDYNAFREFKGTITLKNLNALTSIGAEAFFDASNTDSVFEITDGENKLETIDYNAFREFRGILTLKNLNALTSIGAEAFYNATHTNSLVEITDGNELENIGAGAFQNFDGTIILTNLNNLKYIGTSAFSNAKNIDNVVEITDGDNQLEAIDFAAFFNFNGIITLQNLNALIRIGAGAFSLTGTTTSVVEITEGNVLKTIGGSAFSGFKGTITLKNLNNLKTIGVQAFNNAGTTDSVFDSCLPSKLESVDISDILKNYNGTILNPCPMNLVPLDNRKKMKINITDNYFEINQYENVGSADEKLWNSSEYYMEFGFKDGEMIYLLIRNSIKPTGFTNQPLKIDWNTFYTDVVGRLRHGPGELNVGEFRKYISSSDFKIENIILSKVAIHNPSKNVSDFYPRHTGIDDVKWNKIWEYDYEDNDGFYNVLKDHIGYYAGELDLKQISLNRTYNKISNFALYNDATKPFSFTLINNSNDSINSIQPNNLKIIFNKSISMNKRLTDIMSLWDTTTTNDIKLFIYFEHSLDSNNFNKEWHWSRLFGVRPDGAIYDEMVDESGRKIMVPEALQSGVRRSIDTSGSPSNLGTRFIQKHIIHWNKNGNNTLGIWDDNINRLQIHNNHVTYDMLKMLYNFETIKLYIFNYESNNSEDICSLKIPDKYVRKGNNVSDGIAYYDTSVDIISKNLDPPTFKVNWWVHIMLKIYDPKSNLCLKITSNIFSDAIPFWTTYNYNNLPIANQASLKTELVNLIAFNNTTLEQTIMLFNEWTVGDAVDDNMYENFMYKGESNTYTTKYWNVSKVTSMERLFKTNEDQKTTQISVDNWDVSSVTNMKEMFYNSKIIITGIADWDVSKVEDITDMFFGVSWGDDNPKPDLSKWVDLWITYGIKKGKDKYNYNIKDETRYIYLYENGFLGEVYNYVDQDNYDWFEGDFRRVKYIQANAFKDFKGIITLTNLNNLESIGDNAFLGTTNANSVVEITGENVLQSIGKFAFYKFKGKITLKNLNNLETIGEEAFYNATHTNSLVQIPKTNVLEKISSYAFKEFKGKITLKNLNNLETIGEEAFYNATHTNSLIDKCIPLMDVQDIITGLNGYKGHTLECPAPTTTSNRPTTTSNRPTTTSNRPTTTSNRPTTTSNRPTTTSNRPTTTSNRPTTTSNRPTTTSNRPTTISNRPNTNSGIIDLIAQCSSTFCAQTNSDCKRPCWQEILFHDLLPTNMVDTNNYFLIKHFNASTYLYYNSIDDFGYANIIGYNGKFRFNIAKISVLLDWDDVKSNGYVIFPNNNKDVYLTLSDGTIRFDKKLNGDEQYKQIFGNTPTATIATIMKAIKPN